MASIYMQDEAGAYWWECFDCGARYQTMSEYETHWDREHFYAYREETP